MHLLLAILERLCICYWAYWRQNASVTGHSGDRINLVKVSISDRPYYREYASVIGHICESTQMLLAILERVYICYWSYWRECACVKSGKTGKSMLVTYHAEESVHL